MPNIGCVAAKVLLQHFGDAADVFKAKQSLLEKMEGIGEVRASSIKAFDDFASAEKELKFIEQFKIQALSFTDEAYPKRLLKFYDAPTLLYYRGVADLNAPKIVSVVGTRSNTDYGKQFLDKLIKDFAEHNVLVLSGLAYGIDSIAHKAALKNNLPTVGVLAHGLSKIYPPDHSNLAKEMLQNGGLLTEFTHDTKADKHNFPTRNRIVAGMCDALIVVETAAKGGSMITAEIGYNYNKDMFALPGRLNDAKSAGCNLLIKQGKAHLLTDAHQINEQLKWQTKTKVKPKAQRQLFIELSKDEQQVYDVLKHVESMSIDELNFKTGLSSSSMAAALLMMEMQSLVISLPGKMYKLVD